MYQYPYGDTQQLNLDWILTKIKELEQQSGSGGSSIEEVANALISATYNAATQYRRYDYCFLNGKLYRCLSDTTGAFNPSDWQEALIGDDIPILTRLLNAVDASVTSLQTTVGNQGNAITNLQNAVGNLDSDDVDNASNVVSGASVTAALDDLAGAISTEATARANVDTALQGQITAYIQTNLTASRAYKIGEYFVYNGELYLAKRAISNGAAITIGTNAVKTTLANTINTGSTAYTPAITWSGSTNTPPTVDNVLFSYAMINANLMFIYGRFRLVAKNTTNTSNSLIISIPAEWLTATSRPSPFGLVFGDNIENIVIRPVTDTSAIMFVYGGGGNYSMQYLSEGTYYALFCLMPVKLT